MITIYNNKACGSKPKKRKPKKHKEGKCGEKNGKK